MLPRGAACLDGPSLCAPASEEVLREFLIATLFADAATIERLALEHHDARVLGREAYPKEVAASLAATYRTMGVVHVSGPADVVYLASGALPFPLALVRRDGRWRVDADPLIAVRLARSD